MSHGGLKTLRWWERSPQGGTDVVPHDPQTAVPESPANNKERRIWAPAWYHLDVTGRAKPWVAYFISQGTPCLVCLLPNEIWDWNHKICVCRAIPPRWNNLSGRWSRNASLSVTCPAEQIQRRQRIVEPMGAFGLWEQVVGAIQAQSQKSFGGGANFLVSGQNA